MIGKFPRFTLAALIALSSPIALVNPLTGANAQSGDRISYILFEQGSDSVTMSGSTEDIERARALRRGNEPMLYARRDGVSFVIHDPATLRRAEALFAPQREMGERQAALGSRQAALGSRQAELGAEQARLGARQANATPRQASALSREQHELGARQSELGRQQSALGRQQGALGREQARLGREANAALRVLLADAIRTGAARRVD